MCDRQLLRLPITHSVIVVELVITDLSGELLVNLVFRPSKSGGINQQFYYFSFIIITPPRI